MGSPENGFDEITDILKDEESTLPEDLYLSLIVGKDITGDDFYDDSAANDKINFHLSEQGQSEFPSLSSDLGYYDIPGPCTEIFHSSAPNGCHNGDLLDSSVVDDQKLLFEPWGEQYHHDSHKFSGDYLGDSTFQMDATSFYHEIEKDVYTRPQELVSIAYHTLEGEIIDRPNPPPCARIGEKTFLEALEQELHQAEFTSNEDEEEHEVLFDQIHKFHSPSLHRGDLDSGKEIESTRVDQLDQRRTSQFSLSPVRCEKISVSPGTSLGACQFTDDHRFSASNGHTDLSCEIYIQGECWDHNGDAPCMDHSVPAGRENSATSRVSVQRSQHIEGSSVKSVNIPRNHHRKRSRSRSSGQRNCSSRCKRDSSTNPQASSPYSWESSRKSSNKAACFHLPLRSQNISIPRGHKELSYSSRQCKHKHDLSGSSGRGREVTCQDQLSDSCCKKSSFQHESQERFLNSFSSRHATASPRNNHSLHNHRKVDRSISVSHLRRRDLLSGYRRECYKSRSRSPYGRNRQSLRKVYSPKNQSSSGNFFSQYQYPEIRCLSPVSCRRAGIGKPGTCLFVAGFGFLTTERELERKFSEFGHVRNVRIIRDKRSGFSRGYGFLSLEKNEEADAAIRALHRAEWNGRIILVEKSISN